MPQAARGKGPAGAPALGRAEIGSGGVSTSAASSPGPTGSTSSSRTAPRTLSCP